MNRESPMRYRRFLLFDGIGSLLYSSSGIILGIFFSGQLIQRMAALRRFVVGASTSAFVLTFGYIAFKVIRSRRRSSNPQFPQSFCINRAGTIALTAAAGLLFQQNALPADLPETAEGQSAPKRQWIASLRWENDTFGGTDRFYTDGVALGISHTGPSWMDPVADWLPWGQERRTVTYDVAQVPHLHSGSQCFRRHARSPQCLHRSWCAAQFQK
jgi:hypothetical protein